MLMDLFLSFVCAIFAIFFKYYLTTWPSRYTRVGYIFKYEIIPHFQCEGIILNNLSTSIIGGITCMNHPLFSINKAYWVDIPLTYIYDPDMMTVLGFLFPNYEYDGKTTVGYFAILLVWCIEGSHTLCTKEGFDTLIIAARLLFGLPAQYVCLRWSHSYLLNKYGTDYHQVIAYSYDEDKMAYLAYCFIQAFEIPFMG